jgi:hypothetical protein
MSISSDVKVDRRQRTLKHAVLRRKFHQAIWIHNMRMTRTVPKTDIGKLAKEVISRGPAAALPKNLPDRWLRAIGRDLARAQKAQLEGRDDAPEADLSGALLLVAALQSHQQNNSHAEMEFSIADLKNSLEKFSVAVTDEIIGRETGVFLRRHDINSIV